MKKSNKLGKTIHRLVYDNIGLVRSGAAESFRYIFPHISIKYQQQASDDIHKLTLDDDKSCKRIHSRDNRYYISYFAWQKTGIKRLKKARHQMNILT